MDNKRWILANVLRWAARIWAVASVALIVAVMVGEAFNPARLTPRDWLLFLFFPAGVCVGFVLAWWKELLGGSLTVASLVVFYLIHRLQVGTFPRGLAFAVFAAPGVLFLLAWSLSRMRLMSMSPSVR
jgi:hypothetical protein